MVWRSSKQTVSALSTAEAEIGAAALGWCIMEGLRQLLQDLGVTIDCAKLLIDNKAAIAITECGANWRTRYFAVRGKRLHEEHARGSVSLEHCKTGDMIADGLTKLASHPVLETLYQAMAGNLPARASSALRLPELPGPKSVTFASPEASCLTFEVPPSCNLSPVPSKNNSLAAPMDMHAPSQFSVSSA